MCKISNFLRRYYPVQVRGSKFSALNGTPILHHKDMYIFYSNTEKRYKNIFYVYKRDLQLVVFLFEHLHTCFFLILLRKILNKLSFKKQISMKKTLTLAFAIFGIFLVQAQENTQVQEAAQVKKAKPVRVQNSPTENKKGQEILPQQGDIGIGFNAVPMLDLLFNSMRYVSIMGNSAPTANNVAAGSVTYAHNDNQITGKYFLSDLTAIRVRFGVNTLTGTFINPVEDAAVRYQASLGTADDVTAAELITVNDKMKFSKTHVMSAVGYEIRRGYGRLQGYYGGEFGVGVTSAKEKVEYGNAFSDQYSADFTTDFNAANIATQTPATARIARNTEVSYRGALHIGVRGFVGVEYFVAPKICIGAEYGFGYAFQNRRDLKVKQEVFFNGESGPEVIHETVNLDNKYRNSGFTVDMDTENVFSLNNTLDGNTNLSGGAAAIVITFHF